MGKGAQKSERDTDEARLRAAFRALEAEPVPARLKAHIETLANAARKDRRS